MGFWGAIRRLFASLPEAKIRGFGPGRFSFNLAEGRCPECGGNGMKRIAMNFLPDVRVVCEVCQGQRFNQETLAVRYRERTIADVLAMSVDEAVEFFASHRSIRRPLALLREVGLGYLRLGQASPTLSGGEAQRLKLVTELAKAPEGGEPFPRKKGTADKAGNGTRTKKGTLYLLDEPTIGLHMADIEKLIRALHRLVDAGNTLVIIEHNLDIIAEADWIIDLGPEGGDAGGRIMATGTPRQIAKRKSPCHTGVALAEFLTERSN